MDEDKVMNRLQQKQDPDGVVISVVIATFNGFEYIERCLNSFTEQSIGPDSYEVIVVNNNSTDNTEQLVAKYIRQYNNFFLIDEKQPGVSFARNKGISITRGQYIAFIDDDAYADKDWLKNIVHAYETVTPKPVVIGGRILPYYEIEKPKWFNDSFEIRTKGKEPHFLNENDCKFGFPESNLSITKKIFEEVGGFSTQYGPAGAKMKFGEGSELSRRISEEYPYFWYDPGIIVYHLVPERNMSVKYILSRRSKSAYIYQSFRTPSESILMNIFILCSCIVRIILNALFSIFLVRWGTRKAISDWLSHMIPLVNCTSRSIYILKYFLKIESAPSYE